MVEFMLANPGCFTILCIVVVWNAVEILRMLVKWVSVCMNGYPPAHCDCLGQCPEVSGDSKECGCGADQWCTHCEHEND